MPPQVMEAVCVLLQEKPDWASAKAVLSNVNLTNELRAFDKDNIVSLHGAERRCC